MDPWCGTAIQARCGHPIELHKRNLIIAAIRAWCGLAFTDMPPPLQQHSSFKSVLCRAEETGGMFLVVVFVTVLEHSSPTTSPTKIVLV